MQNCIVASGGNYSYGYFQLMELSISDLLYHLEVFADLQEKIRPIPDKHTQAGFVDCEFYDVPP